MAHFLPPELVRQVNKLEWPKSLVHFFQAKSIKNEASGPYRAMSHIQELTTTLDPECVTLDQLFKRAVMMNGGRQALGTREVLREEDEMQPNGRVFKKVSTDVALASRASACLFGHPNPLISTPQDTQKSL